MNIKCSYHVHKYNTRGSHDLHVSDCTTSVYQNGVFNTDIKSYNELLKEYKSYTHLIVVKKSSNQYFCKMASVM
jgi:hypothetical protein